MAIEISLVRHGETEANAAGVWQGSSDSPLSMAGRDQVTRLGQRFEANRFDLVLTSDLGRALQTATVIGGAEVDERWRELHLGSWEGLTQSEIADRDPDVAAALGSGADIAFGGGERVSDMVERLIDAFYELADRLADGERALVIGHGGALLTLISVLLGVDTRHRILRLTNTSVTTIRVQDGRPQLATFNDMTHLAGDPVRADEGSTHVILARHGETVANLEARWQGQTGGSLTERGRDQARRLANVFPSVDALYSSSLTRAVDTARFVADGHRIELRELPDLQEISFGRWERMTRAEVESADPSAWAELVSGIDVARGGTGETFGQVQQRMHDAIGAMADHHSGKKIGVISHGGATRAFAARVLGLDFAGRQALGLLDNTAMARVVYSSRGPALASWNLTPHLGG